MNTKARTIQERIKQLLERNNISYSRHTADIGEYYMVIGSIRGRDSRIPASIVQELLHMTVHSAVKIGAVIDPIDKTRANIAIYF